MADPALSHHWQRGALHTYRFGLTAAKPALFEHAPRQDPAPTYYDMHLELEFGVVLEGAMERSFEGFTRELGPGDVWYCGVWEPHGSRAARRGTASLHFVALPTWLSALRFPEAPTFSPILPFTVPPARRPRPDEAQRARIRGLG
ncbi:MAG: hypothetical protein H0X45_14115, partial [Planctomycetes bacterium]|nr:hypothetical protein [Planctomycetota bacterium]